MYIKNLDALLDRDIPEESLKLRRLLLNSLEKAMDAVRPTNLIKKSVKIENNLLKIKGTSIHLAQFQKCIIIGGGKATAEMVSELEKLLISHGKIEFGGIINIPKGLAINKQDFSGKVELNFASHPIPDEEGQKGTKKMIELVKNATSKDLIICLMSGGGSALLPLPREGVSLEDLKEINALLLGSGANIEEINAVRKHLSAFKGGQLAKTAESSNHPTIISFIISDVIGNRLDTIASGPTVPDQTTYEDALECIKKYDIYDLIPSGARDILEAGIKNQIPETPKRGDKCFKKTYNFIIGSSDDAAVLAEKYLRENGVVFQSTSKKIQGEARRYGRKCVEKFNIISQKFKNLKEGMIGFIGSGELTVTIRGKGTGGRNQEFLLSFLNELEREKLDFRFALISANLDGIDGNSEAMGAIVDNSTISKYSKLNLDPNEFLNDNNSNAFFKEVGDEILTGYTGINVNDLTIGILLKKSN